VSGVSEKNKKTETSVFGFWNFYSSNTPVLQNSTQSFLAKSCNSDLALRQGFLKLSKYYYALWDSGQEHRMGASLIAAQAVPKL
jgi:hypothetical protein